MANFIKDEVLGEVIEMVREHLFQYQEKIDTLYGDDEKKKAVTVGFTINITSKGGTQIETKTTIDFVEVPSTPAKKVKNTTKRLIDLNQVDLFDGKKEKSKGKRRLATVP